MPTFIAKSVLVNLLLVISFFLVILGRLTFFPARNYVILIQLICAIITHIYVYNRCRKNQAYIRFFWLLICINIIFGINLFTIGNVTLRDICYSGIIGPSIALLLFFFDYSKNVAKLIFYGIVLIFSTLLFSMLFTLDDLTVNSRNYVSFYYFLFALPYFIYCSNHKIAVSFIPIIIILCFAFYAVGRGGIIMSLILLAGIIFVKIFVEQRKYKIFRTIFIITIFSILYFVLSSELTSGLFSRFQEKQIESQSRFYAWAEYIMNLNNVPNIILGVKIQDLQYTNFMLYGSLHNSYLTLHAKMGIFSLMILLLIAKGFINLIKWKHLYTLIPLLCLFVKAFVDADFPGLPVGGDIYLYYILLCSLHS